MRSSASGEIGGSSGEKKYFAAVCDLVAQFHTHTHTCTCTHACTHIPGIPGTIYTFLWCSLQNGSLASETGEVLVSMTCDEHKFGVYLKQFMSGAA